MKELIAGGLASLGYQAPDQAASQLAEYGHLLLEGNQTMNLTAITDPVQVARLHMLDCACLLNCVNLRGPGKRLIDVGTGAGFPGLVLKILVPELEVVLLDAQQKRLHWLEEVIERLGLEGVTTVHGRAEEGAHCPALRQSFDFSSARAVAQLATLCELCLPFVRPGGMFLAMKSVDSDTELAQSRRAIEVLGGREEPVQDYTIPGTGVVHRLILIRKTDGTPGQYPRRWAKIQKSPILSI